MKKHIIIGCLGMMAWVGAWSQPTALGLKEMEAGEPSAMRIYGDSLFVSTPTGIWATALRGEDGWKPYAFAGDTIVDFVKSGNRMLVLRKHEEPRAGWASPVAVHELVYSSDYGNTVTDKTPKRTAHNHQALFSGITQDGERLYMGMSPSETLGESSQNELGMMVSQDFGENWRESIPISDGLYAQGIQSDNFSVILSPTDSQCGMLVGNNGKVAGLRPTLWRTADGFLTFDGSNTEIGNTNEDRGDIQAYHATYCPTDKNTVLLCTWNGMMKSRDGGQNWTYTTGEPMTLEQIVQQGYSRDEIFRAVFYNGHRPTEAYALSVYKNDALRLYRSTDNGDSWTLACEYPSMAISAIGTLYDGLYYFRSDGEVYALNPEEATAIERPQADTPSSAGIRDLQGRKLSGKPRQGIYLRGSHKYIMK